MALEDAELQRLVAAALTVQQRAYAPYSNFFVGAAILSSDGQIFNGCNVENASFGLTVCAERGAISQAIAQGSRDWKAIAVASRGAVTPCGACRQVLHEFGKSLEVILIDAETSEIRARWTTDSLLPGAFVL